ncbi:DHH family phosphoesterase [Tuwongella immobilis]|uniref:DDH domain-containing protein n=1 Tax=Tuwongella immobilis TaxID=692036 RepID=A0A6C2YS74_9BACT|nr:bifunctional oligoribonuclease/PAP phosphatase NrnA [Tuwongella immobilis]VIP04197.1 phosphoesterase domain protein : Phosphoesterase RecJ domain protein OS=Planctomyces limnophilus (strain ATCC 43296 / DSM 3776 / IFAM 1008 / 290) GN=Plim_0422 PE=4 SV=1: DHH: DHHA1 [Tuwongella immobilis]VTS05758.1 phosphoesterase domain protein : Phosphoesterase RecJ domain protein OS=Planctomyces limnophilus (strain ATCC 43296 / DSM 3776 / IFAM 1008 / 290) GN=Plim_0422 PE=4 SV=1: DHH: DHHA1 [Tuwongella immobi
MSIDWQPFREFVQKHHRFLLLTHVRPDPDALGSLLAMADCLTQLGKVVRPVIQGPMPERLAFLDADNRVQTFVPPGDTLRDVDAVIVMDTGTWNQLGDTGTFVRSLGIPVAVIDHHVTQDIDTPFRFVDVTAEAAGRLIYDASVALGIELTPPTATRMFAALATDTGWFRHASTKPSTYRLAESLMTQGANPTKIYDSLYEQGTLAQMQLLGRVLGRLQTAHLGRLAWTELWQSDLQQSGVGTVDSGDFIHYPRSLAGVDVAMLLTEWPERVKISFRSRGRVDVSQIAEQFGGGGHRMAAAAILPGDLQTVRAQIVALFEPLLLALPPA